MGHEIAKLLLEKADTFLARVDAVKSALELGMPLHEIEQYLDWLEMLRGGTQGPSTNGLFPPAESETRTSGDA